MSDEPLFSITHGMTLIISALLNLFLSTRSKRVQHKFTWIFFNERSKRKLLTDCTDDTDSPTI